MLDFECWMGLLNCGIIKEFQSSWMLRFIQHAKFNIQNFSRVHRQRNHQQAEVHPLIGECLMWIIRFHLPKGIDFKI